MLDPHTVMGICAAVEQGFDEQVDFTSELIRYPSTRGAEAPAQDHMALAMRERGLNVDRWQIDIDAISHLPGFSPVNISYENAYNVVGAHRPAQVTGRSLILNGHIDVVPEGPVEMWASPPFEPRREGHWLYGRGSGDMKAGLASALFAFEALKRAGFEPAADVFVQSVVEEECTGNGALACLQRGYRAQAALIPEPLQDRLLSAQTGTIWLQVEVLGLPAHAASATSGFNAIKGAMRLIAALDVVEERWNAEKAQHADHAHHEHPIHINVGRIEGGEWPSSVPARCVFDIRAGIYADDDIEARRAELEAALAEAAAGDPELANQPPRITCHGFMAEGYQLTNADEQVELLSECHQLAYGSELEQVALTATTDARFFGLYADIPALVYGPVARSIHGFNECVDLESVRKNTQAIALFVAHWCGLNRI